MQITAASKNIIPLARKLISSITSRLTLIKSSQNAKATSDIKELHNADGLGEKCGIFAYMSQKSSVKIGQILSAAMQRLQHRGQKAAGYAYFTDDRENVSWAKASKSHRSDPVNELLKPEVINPMIGKFGIGHTLYATSKTDNKVHTQPIKFGEGEKRAFLVHNGNLPDCTKVKNFLTERKIDIKDSNDSMLIAKMLEYFYNENEHELQKAMRLMVQDPSFPEGAYSLIAMDKDKIVAIKDRYGNKPLTIGTTENGDLVLSSESAAFDPIGAKIIRDVRAGEMLVITPKTTAGEIKKEPEPYDAVRKKTLASSILFPDVKPAFSAFEYVYFSRPDTIYEGESVHEVRRRLGNRLGEVFREAHPDLNIDYVVPVPESGRSAAEAFSEKTGIPLNSSLIKNKHKRTFIEEDTDGDSKVGGRDKRVKEKFSIIKDSIKGKDILLVDDSIVRSTTVKVIAEMYREAGAKSVHFAIPAPPIRFPNFYGVDTPRLKELAATQFHNDKAFGENLGLDSLTFLKPKEFEDVISKGLDMSDFDGDYKIPIGDYKENIIKTAKEENTIKKFSHLRKLSDPSKFPSKELAL